MFITNLSLICFSVHQKSLKLLLKLFWFTKLCFEFDTNISEGFIFFFLDAVDEKLQLTNKQISCKDKREGREGGRKRST